MDAIQGAKAAIFPNTSAVTPQSEGKREQIKTERTQERNRAEAGRKLSAEYIEAPAKDGAKPFESVTNIEDPNKYENISTERKETGNGKYGNFDRTA